jgi:hypothetical protein
VAGSRKFDSSATFLVERRKSLHSSAGPRRLHPKAAKSENSLSDPFPTRALTLVEALIDGADPGLWRRYCLLTAELEGRPKVAPVYALGSVEWQRQQDQKSTNEAEQALPVDAEDSGRKRISRRGAPAPFAGAPSPFGAAGPQRSMRFWRIIVDPHLSLRKSTRSNNGWSQCSKRPAAPADAASSGLATAPG